MAGPEDFLPPSFWAASISCLFLSSSSICFFLAWASASFLSCSSFLIFFSLVRGSHTRLLTLPGGPITHHHGDGRRPREEVRDEHPAAGVHLPVEGRALQGGG